MEILYVLVPVALVIAGAAVLAFRWAVRDGQFDDLDTPPVRVLFDDPEHEPPAGDGLVSSHPSPPSAR